MKRWDEALAWCDRALSLWPDHLNILARRAAVMLELRRPPREVLAALNRALGISPDHEGALRTLAGLYEKTGDLASAEAVYRKALAAHPLSARALFGRSKLFRATGRFAEAEADVRRLCAVEPDNPLWWSVLLFTAASRGAPPAEVSSIAVRFGDVADRAAPARQAPMAFVRAPRRDRPLRIGYISGDFRRHPVSRFVEALFKAHDRSRAEVFAYSNHPDRDAATERIEGAADSWASIIDWADPVVLRRMEADRIDVLVDLSGHTEAHRLGLLASRAAPVQAHYLGFFATTGVKAIDYWIGDPVVTPPTADDQFSETVWRLPRVWVSYDPPADAPTPRRDAPDGFVRLGGFNAFAKHTPATFDLWAEILRSVPEARLLMKTKELANPAARAGVIAAFEQRGVAADRLELFDIAATVDWKAHMAFYSRVDVALDPVGGLGGGTTTCDALWMGVPVVTLAGDRPASRMSASMLDAIGAPELVTHSPEGYVRTAAALARDPGRLDAIRARQRDRMVRSPLCDTKGLAGALEDAYEAMFDRWSADHGRTAQERSRT
jgi:predicted O-linked N-acetylglucosamine transferase (SPINDLY family)